VGAEIFTFTTQPMKTQRKNNEMYEIAARLGTSKVVFFKKILRRRKAK
jgi:hypothetical protein